METKLTKRTDTEAQLSVVLDEAALRPIKNEVFNDLRRQVKAAGFRPGHAPDAIVERELGSQVVQGEFVEHAIQHSYVDAVRAENLPVIGQPNVTLEKFVPYTELSYKVTVELMPKIKLADYKKIRVKREAIKIDPAEVGRTIEDLRRREATRLTSEQPAAKGDEVNFDFAGTKDGQTVPGATAKNQTLQLGSGSFIPGFEEQIIGLRAGSEKTFDIRFPKGYHEASLADQLVTFQIKINSVTQLVLPQVDREFVEKISPFKSVDELRADITEKITAEKAQAASRAYEQQVLDKLLKDSKYQTPESLVAQQLERLRAELEQNLAYSGLNIEKYLELSKKTLPELEKDLRPEAERRVALAMALTEVASLEGLKVDTPELDAEIKRLAQDYPDPKAQAELDNPSTREEVYNHLMASKVIRRLVEYAGGEK